MQSASGRTYFAFIAFMSLLLDDDFLPVHDVEAAWQVGCAGLLHEAAVDGVDGGGRLGVGRGLVDADGGAVEGIARHAGAGGLRQGEVGLTGLAGEGGAVLSGPIEAEVLALCVVREHVEEAAVALGVHVVGRAAEQVACDGLFVARGEVVVVCAGLTLDEDSRPGGDHVAVVVAVVNHQFAVGHTRDDGGLQPFGQDDCVVAVSGSVAVLVHLDAVLHVEAGLDALLVGVSTVGFVFRAILDELLSQYVGDLHRTVGLRLNRPRVAVLAVSADVEAGVRLIHVQVAAIGVLNGVSAFGLGQREAVEQVRGAHEVSRGGLIDGEVVVSAVCSDGLGDDSRAFVVGSEDVGLSALYGGRLHVVAQRRYVEGELGRGGGELVGLGHRGGDRRGALGEGFDASVGVNGGHFGVRAGVGHCAVARAVQCGSGERAGVEQVERGRLGCEAELGSLLAAYFFVEHGANGSLLFFLVRTERVVARAELHIFVHCDVRDEERAVGLRFDGPYSVAASRTYVEAIKCSGLIEVTSVSLLDIVATFNRRDCERIGDVLHVDVTVGVRSSRGCYIEIAIRISCCGDGLSHANLSVIFHDDEVALAARDGRHFLELGHAGHVGDGQRVAGRTGHVRVRFGRRSGDGGGACAHKGHVAGRGVHGGHARFRAGVCGGCVGGLGQRRGGERAAQVNGELRLLAKREAGSFLAGHNVLIFNGNTFHPNGFGLVIDGDCDNTVCGFARKGVFLVRVGRTTGDFSDFTVEVRVTYFHCDGVTCAACRSNDGNRGHAVQAFVRGEREYVDGSFAGSKLDAARFVATRSVRFKLLGGVTACPAEFALTHGKILVSECRYPVGITNTSSSHDAQTEREEDCFQM